MEYLIRLCPYKLFRHKQKLVTEFAMGPSIIVNIFMYKQIVRGVSVTKIDALDFLSLFKASLSPSKKLRYYSKPVVELQNDDKVWICIA